MTDDIIKISSEDILSQIPEKSKGAQVVERYPPEELGDDDDDGTMPESLKDLSDAVVGHRIVDVLQGSFQRGWERRQGHLLVLDNGNRVFVEGVSDCCAYTDITQIIKVLDQIDHVVTGVGTTDGFTTWHIYADLGDLLELKVDWSCGNPFYYAYGFNIQVFTPAELPDLQIES